MASARFQRPATRQKNNQKGQRTVVDLAILSKSTVQVIVGRQICNQANLNEAIGPLRIEDFQTCSETEDMEFHSAEEPSEDNTVVFLDLSSREVGFSYCAFAVVLVEVQDRGPGRGLIRI